MIRKIAIFALMLALVPAYVMAAGSWSATSYSTTLDSSSSFKWIQWTFTADADNASVPALSISATDLAYMKKYFIYSIETDPGTTGPTNGAWDVVITDTLSYPVTVSNLSSSTSSKTYAPGGGYFPIDGTALTVTITDNAVNSASAVVRIWLSK